jgi:hypothetical protein
MDLAISIGIGGWILLVAAALIVAVAFQFFGEGSTYGFAADAIAVAIGALFASEIVVAWRTVEPVWDGLALVPALLGGLAAGAIVDLASRYLTGGRTAGRPISA